MEQPKKFRAYGRKLLQFIFVLLGGSLGATYFPSLWQTFNISNEWLTSQVTNILLGAIILFCISFFVADPILAGIRRLEKIVSQLSVAWLVGLPFTNLQIPAVTQALPIALSIIFGYLGFYVGTTRREDILRVFTVNKKKTEDSPVLERKAGDNFRKYKLLDTSVIIDGRIYDIAKTGFIEGVLVIPVFVLNELQYIADSADSLKRVRGRRGLDILNALQKEEHIQVEIYEGDYDDINEVDRKLIRLAKSIDGIIITNDFNLNKVSEFQNVPVFNINALAQAIKPVVIPGETLKTTVVKQGTERQQGVAYLDDGTMIVVEDGQYYMNEEIEVVVTSALQTAAGRMIFAKPLHSQKKIKQ
mgnify:CR=1 FL=1